MLSLPFTELPTRESKRKTFHVPSTTHPFSLSFWNRLLNTYKENAGTNTNKFLSLCFSHQYILKTCTHTNVRPFYAEPENCVMPQTFMPYVCLQVNEEKMPTDKNDFCWWGGKTLKMFLLSLSFWCHEGMISWKQKVHGNFFSFLWDGKLAYKKLRVRPWTNVTLMYSNRYHVKVIFKHVYTKILVKASQKDEKRFKAFHMACFSINDKLTPEHILITFFFFCIFIS